MVRLGVWGSGSVPLLGPQDIPTAPRAPVRQRTIRRYSKLRESAGTLVSALSTPHWLP
jgi:hypothetical protein